jgi:predicted DCC family thiol-disulfide oxidoreductase YuxK
MKKVFYDGNCPICKREIELYKQLNKNKSIAWYNIYSDKKALKIINKSKEECLKAFHVIDDNKIYKETEAFFILWKDIKYFKILYYLFNYKLIRYFLNIFYKIYAKYRYNKLYIKKEDMNEKKK